MSYHSGPAPIARSNSILRGPWGVYLGAIGLTLLGYLANQMGWNAAQAACVMAGLIAAGSAVAWRLQTTGWSLDDRIESACVTFLSGMLAEVDLHTVAAPWDGVRMFLRVLAVVGAVGALLIVLPSLVRRIVISLLVIFHFGGIVTAVTSVEPPGAPAPWLAVQAWSRVYRYYLTFMYLNNAYHFYSPEPGPPTLVWFRMHYADDTYRWVKIPVREESPVPLHYQRMLALTESTNMVNAQPLNEPEFNEKLHRRRLAGNIKNIPLHPLMTPHNQYREPQAYSKRMISAYARFASRHFHHLDDPNVPVTSVRIYKVTHNIVLPSDLALGYSPIEKTLYMPYYMGEFDTAGKLLEPDDPFLYWLLPIFPENINEMPLMRLRAPGAAAPSNKIIDCLEIHGGDQAPTKHLESRNP